MFFVLNTNIEKLMKTHSQQKSIFYFYEMQNDWHDLSHDKNNNVTNKPHINDIKCNRDGIQHGSIEQRHR